MKASKSILIGLLITLVLSIIPPNKSVSQIQTVEDKIEVIKTSLNKSKERLNNIVEVKKPEEPKIIYKIKTVTRTVKKDRKIIIKVDNIYFETVPSIDEEGNYVIDFDELHDEKKENFKKLGIDKKWWQIFKK